MASADELAKALREEVDASRTQLTSTIESLSEVQTSVTEHQSTLEDHTQSLGNLAGSVREATDKMKEIATAAAQEAVVQQKPPERESVDGRPISHHGERPPEARPAEFMPAPMPMPEPAALLEQVTHSGTTVEEVKAIVAKELESKIGAAMEEKAEEISTKVEATVVELDTEVEQLKGVVAAKSKVIQTIDERAKVRRTVWTLSHFVLHQFTSCHCHVSPRELPLFTSLRPFDGRTSLLPLT